MSAGFDVGFDPDFPLATWQAAARVTAKAGPSLLGLAACGGVPKELRTDRLSAASRNRDGSYALDITSRYQALCAHYGLSPSRNNCGVALENGIVEAPHGHVKRRLEQRLILRGSCDFEEAAEYGELLAEVFSALNARRQRRYEQELEHLGSLPAFRFTDYELLKVRLRRSSTIEVRQGGPQQLTAN